MRSLAEEQPEVSEAEQPDLSELCVKLAGDNTYRLVSVISHCGGTTHAGHYVADVYSLERDHWLHYDDSRVSRV